ncbi:hypothetical protein CCP3SC5AM1_320001 [Gammaproteobacteria bacterium]
MIKNSLIEKMEISIMSNKGSDEIDLATFFLMIDGAIKARRFLAIGLFFGAIIIALAFAFLSTPIYKAELLLSIINQQGGSSLSGLGASMLGGIGFGPEDADQAANIAALTSRAVVNSFIEKNNLIPILFETNWDKENKKWINDKKPTDGDAYRLFTKYICSVTPDKKTGIVSLTIDWTDPEIAASWANDFVRHADLYMRQETIEDSQRGIDFLQAELRKTTTVEVQQSILQLMESQFKKSMMANTASRYVYKVLDPATVPDRKDRPKRLLILILGGLLGAMLGIFVPLIILQLSRFRARIHIYRQALTESESQCE